MQVRQQSTSEFDEEWRSVRHLANEWSRHGIQGNNDVSEDCEGKKTVDRLEEEDSQTRFLHLPTNRRGH